MRTDVLQGDWIILARQLDITEEEITKIQTEYTYVSEQALVMLHLWVQKNQGNATGGKSHSYYDDFLYIYMYIHSIIRIGKKNIVNSALYIHVIKYHS